MLNPCSPPGSPQPTIRSSTEAGSRAGTLASAADTICASRSSGRIEVSDPLKARPIGERAAATMTASGMICASLCTCHCHVNSWITPQPIASAHSDTRDDAVNQGESHVQVHNSLTDVMGNTPLIRLKSVTSGVAKTPTVLAKVEYLNLGGSVPD